MAPLKRWPACECDVLRLSYPCLKGHGPIEATDWISSAIKYGGYPCLKGHGPIEATLQPLPGQSQHSRIHA